MQLTRGDTQHCHRLAPQDRRPRRRSWPIPPARSDLVGEADKLLAATQPARPTPPPPCTLGTEKQLTARADRPVPDSAHAVAFTTAVAIRGAGSVHRRTGMQTARAFPGGPGRPGSPPAIPPALTAIQTRCCAHHHPLVAQHPMWRCEAGAGVRRADGSIPGPHVPRSTLRPALASGGVCLGAAVGSLQQPCRFLPAHRRCT